MANGFGPVFCIVRRNQRELQLSCYRCRKQHRGGYCVSVWCLNHTTSKCYNCLSVEDHRRRLDFYLQLQDLMSSDDHFLEKVQFSDEATFHVSGAVNRRNVRIWGCENPRAYWSINFTLLQSMCLVRSPVKKPTLYSSLLKKPLLA